VAAPEWFVGYLDALRRVPGSRPASARALAEWAAQIGDDEAPSRPTVNRWVSGTTLPTDFRALELVVQGVKEHTKNPTRQQRETLLRPAWWREAYQKAVRESGRGNGGERTPQVVYQGLEPFGRDDAARFFGRDREIKAMLGRLDALQRSPDSAVLAVLGQSGIGKSSLLAAGLLPALETRGLPSSPEVASWPAAVITPGSTPLQNLREFWERHAASSDSGDETAPRNESILVVDQFEEVFQLDPAIRQQFVAELFSAASSPAGGGESDPTALVVIACRNEFYPELRQLALLKPALDAPFNLDPLTGEALAEAIREPARRAGITVGNDLVNRLLADAGVRDGGLVEGKLPLISHVLRLMNQSGPMTVRSYERVGGIDGAVAHTADQAWEELRQAGLEDAALALLVRLVRVGEYPGHDTRRPLDRAQLPGLGDGPTGQALEILARARLITIGEDTVQITHEALIRAWQLLRDTIDSERADLVLRQSIALRARQWDEAGRPPEQLLRGTVLADAHRVIDTGVHATVADDMARQFLDEADRQEQLAAARRRRQWIAVVAAAVLIVAAGTVAVISGIAERQASQRAILSEVIAHAKQLADTDTSMSAQLWLTAYRMQPTPDLYTALLSTENTPLSRQLLGHTGNVRAVGQIDKTIISTSADGTIRLWPSTPTDAAPTTLNEPGPVTSMVTVPQRHIMITGAGGRNGTASTIRVWGMRDDQHPEPLSPELPVERGKQVSGLATSTDGRLLAIVTTDGSARLWEIGNPARPADLGSRLPGTTTAVYGSNVAISPDDRTLAVAGPDGSTKLWNITDPQRPAELSPLPSGTGIAHAVAFSPTRNILVTGGGNSSLRLWDVADPAQARLLGASRGGPDASPSILSLDISPDEQTVAVGGADNMATLFNISDPTRPFPLGEPLAGHERGVATVAFAEGGRTLITGSADDTVRIWSLPTTRLAGIAGNATAVVFSHDNKTLAVGGGKGDRSVHLWDVTDPTLPKRASGPLPADGDVDSIAITRDDSVLAAASGPVVRMWNIHDPYRPVRAGPDIRLPAVAAGLAISPDNRTLAVGSTDGLTRLFDLNDPARPTQLSEPLVSTPGELVTTAAFTPDGRILATAGNDHDVRLWDVSVPSQPRPAGILRGHTDNIFKIAISPDGTRLASVGANHTVRVWNIADPAQPREEPPLLEQTESVGGVAWSSDSALLATGSSDTTIALWDMTNPDGGRLVGTPITGHTDNIYAVSFGPPGVLASGGRDRVVRLWDLSVDRAISRICSSTADALTERAWDTFVSPDRSYDPPCPAFAEAGHTSNAWR